MTIEMQGRTSRRFARPSLVREVVRVILLAAVLVVYFGAVTALAGELAGANAQGGPSAAQNSAQQNDGAQARASMPRKKWAKKNAEPQLSIREHLDKNTALAEKLQSMLPWGMDLFDICDGFRSLDDLVAAVHVSNNLGIRFLSIRNAMTGKQPASLARIIRKMNPNVNAEYEQRRAVQEARADLEQFPLAQSEAPAVAGR